MHRRELTCGLERGWGGGGGKDERTPSAVDESDPAAAGRRRVARGGSNARSGGGGECGRRGINTAAMLAEEGLGGGVGGATPARGRRVEPPPGDRRGERSGDGRGSGGGRRLRSSVASRVGRGP